MGEVVYGPEHGIIASAGVSLASMRESPRMVSRCGVMEESSALKAVTKYHCEDEQNLDEGFQQGLEVANRSLRHTLDSVRLLSMRCR